MSTIVMRSASGAGMMPEQKCVAAVARWLEMHDQAEIEDAISSFVPADQPLRDAYLDHLVKVNDPALHRHLN